MPMMIEMRLKDGRDLIATCVIVSSSDRGAMMFTPSDRATRNFVAKAHDDAKKLFGTKPVILVPPSILDRTSKRQEDPACQKSYGWHAGTHWPFARCKCLDDRDLCKKRVRATRKTQLARAPRHKSGPPSEREQGRFLAGAAMAVD
jgi:hypothetical protein